ncbi:DUF3139 domain-containing protein [Paenibacillus sp. MZ04-78.2]|uniref:DUF3139 domain-containing protein n=1 Tax=Paenibacillus sp. MZ04-78.2 TaxID=2962034 RepID=UPI0020B90220|nr:DUF3139 domain-containing protein [Paenibacillus sp. MZ04-78.2]MCP3776637.1 DUF3139 domain-containing protein [Paenibacillus sp. MZ04-78.2]
MKKILLSILLILILIIGGIYGYIQIKLNDLEKKMLLYLVETKHYKESDILNIKGKFGKMPTYVINVVFKNEPEVTYNYTLRDDQQWIQLGPSDGDIERNKYTHIDEKRLK